MIENLSDYIESPEQTPEQKLQRLIAVYFFSKDRFESAVRSKIQEIQKRNKGWFSDLEILEELIDSDKLKDFSSDEKSILISGIDGIRRKEKNGFLEEVE